MRTKTLLLSAAVAAAGFASSSMAQVYSVNIVGYANRTWAGNKYTLDANPFDDGNGNHLTNVANALPSGSAILTWGGASFNTASKISGVWNADAILAPGTGYFVRNGKVPAPPNPVVPTLTNTYVGSLVANSGSSVSTPIPLGYQLFGSPVPFTGLLTQNGTSAGDTNLNVGARVTAGSQVLTWNQALQTYNTATKITGIWNADSPITVGEGFFIRNKSGPVTNFVQIVP